MRIESPVASEARTAVRRRETYRSSIARGDYFVVHHLHAFLQRALREWVKPGLRVADVGCGEQPLRTLITSLGAHYTGIDVHQNLKGLVDVVADITDIPLPDRSFDLVLCTEVLEHVSNTYAAFAELTRLCKPGGTVILTTPFCYPLHEEPYDFVRLTPHQIRKCADISNLDVIQLTTSGNELQVAATVWCNLWSRIGSGRRSTMRAVRNVLMRLPVNLVVAALTPLLDPILPRKYFLSTFCILRKRT